jgi:phage tail sheath protein FI
MPVPTAYVTPGVYVEWLDSNAQQPELARTDVAGLVGITERGPVHVPVKIDSYRQFYTTFGERIADGHLAYAVAGFFENGGRTCWVVRVADPATVAAARVRLLVEGREPFVLQAVTPGTWGNTIEVQGIWGRDRITHVIARTPDDREQTIDLDALRGPRPAVASRIRTNLLGVADEGLQEQQAQVIVGVAPDDPNLPGRALSAAARTVRLEGGADGLATLTTAHFTGDPDENATWGVTALESVDLVSFVAVPDLMAGRVPARGATIEPFDDDEIRDAQIAVINSCIRRRDRIAILDMPPINQPAVIASATAPGRWPATSYAAFYHPWIVVDDPLRLDAIVRHVPPSGHVAGMYARVDRRRGVHRPPANEPLEGAFDVREGIDEEAHGELNENGVNAIRAIPGRGILVLGVRTLDSDIRWRYVNIRRLFNAIEEALDEQMQWVTFELNSPRLWREIDRAVRGLLERLYRAGMLDGETSDQAYVVRCDASTNPPSETDDGRVTCVIGLQPPYPAEFVVVRIGVTRSGIQIEEKGSQDA